MQITNPKSFALLIQRKIIWRTHDSGRWLDYLLKFWSLHRGYRNTKLWGTFKIPVREKIQANKFLSILQSQRMSSSCMHTVNFFAYLYNETVQNDQIGLFKRNTWLSGAQIKPGEDASKKNWQLDCKARTSTPRSHWVFMSITSLLGATGRNMGKQCLL